jgi:glycosyltransferase involved in cell wall biosynthesis
MVPAISVIIPTRDRHERLAATLAAVRRQTCPAGQLEVIVVDDGSSDETPQVVQGHAPSGVAYVRQPHRGACAARNNGAALARGRLLVFVDDDVELGPEALTKLVTAHADRPGAVILGHLTDPAPANRYQRLRVFARDDVPPGTAPVPCTECFTGLLSIDRERFFELGQFQDPTGGWPSWDDIDFGYRARKAGVELIRSSEARGIHHDESATSLKRTAQRWRAASVSAVRLFIRYPDLQGSLPFYRDKLPIVRGGDSSLLMLRKLVRSVGSARPVLELVERTTGLLVRIEAPAGVTRALCGWVISGNMWQGLRAGIELYGPLPAPVAEEP